MLSVIKIETALLLTREMIFLFVISERCEKRIISIKLKEPPSIGDSFVYCTQNNIPILIRKTCNQNFRNKVGDLFRRKIYNADNLFANKRFRIIVLRDLGTTFFNSKLS